MSTNLKVFDLIEFYGSLSFFFQCKASANFISLEKNPAKTLLPKSRLTNRNTWEFCSSDMIFRMGLFYFYVNWHNLEYVVSGKSWHIVFLWTKLVCQSLMKLWILFKDFLITLSTFYGGLKYKNKVSVIVLSDAIPNCKSRKRIFLLTRFH